MLRPMGKQLHEGRKSPTGPLWWIVIAPLVTVPATQAWTAGIAQSDACTVSRDFLGGAALCPTETLAMALAPGLINLVPALWLPFGRAVRKTAVVATALGLARFLVPLAALLTSGPDASVSWGFFPVYPNEPSILVASVGLWLISVLALVLFAREAGRWSRPSIKARLAGLARQWQSMWE